MTVIETGTDKGTTVVKTGMKIIGAKVMVSHNNSVETIMLDSHNVLRKTINLNNLGGIIISHKDLLKIKTIIGTGNNVVTIMVADSSKISLRKTIRNRHRSKP